MVTKIKMVYPFILACAYGLVLADLTDLARDMIMDYRISTKLSTYVDKVHEEFRIEDTKEPEISLSRTEELEKVEI